MKKEQLHNRREIVVENNGIRIKGDWYSEKGVITVEGWHDNKYFKKSTQLGGFASDPEKLAIILIKEIIN